MMDTIKGAIVDGWEVVMLDCPVCQCPIIPVMRLPAETIEGQAIPLRLGIIREVEGMVHEWTLAEHSPGQSEDELAQAAEVALAQRSIVCSDCKTPPVRH